MEIPPKLKKYIDTNRGSLPPITDPDEPLQIDSLNLIEFLENEFGYQIEDEELIAENFATLRRLGQLLATKTPTVPTAEANTCSCGDIPSVLAKNCTNSRSIEGELETVKSLSKLTKATKKDASHQPNH